MKEPACVNVYPGLSKLFAIGGDKLIGLQWKREEREHEKCLFIGLY